MRRFREMHKRYIELILRTRKEHGPQGLDPGEHLVWLV